MQTYARFILKLHTITCIWLFIGRMDNTCELLCFDSEGWIKRNPAYEDMTPLFLYANAMNLMTETISSVGYGMPNAPLNSIEMCYLICVIIFNFNDLTAIFMRVRQLKHYITIRDCLKETKREVETYVSKLES